jgi:hypothetical protein
MVLVRMFFVLILRFTFFSLFNVPLCSVLLFTLCSLLCVPSLTCACFSCSALCDHDIPYMYVPN